MIHIFPQWYVPHKLKCTISKLRKIHFNRNTFKQIKQTRTLNAIFNVLLFFKIRLNKLNWTMNVNCTKSMINRRIYMKWLMPTANIQIPIRYTESEFRSWRKHGHILYQIHIQLRETKRERENKLWHTKKKYPHQTM